MAAQVSDLNLEPPDLDVNHGEWDGPADKLVYDMLWADADRGGFEQEDGAGEDGAGHGGSYSVDAGSGAGGGGAAGEKDGGAAPVDRLHALVDGGGAPIEDGTATLEGSYVRKRRFYSDDLKIAIYLELLARTHPPVLHHGVSKQVAQKFHVPLRLVQSVWRNGQDYGGIEGVKNKLAKNCGRKRVEIDMEAIKSVPPRNRTTFRDLANALGVKKSTLHSRFKEGYFGRHTTTENKKARGIIGEGTSATGAGKNEQVLSRCWR